MEAYSWDRPDSSVRGHGYEEAYSWDRPDSSVRGHGYEEAYSSDMPDSSVRDMVKRKHDIAGICRTALSGTWL